MQLLRPEEAEGLDLNRHGQEVNIIIGPRVRENDVETLFSPKQDEEIFWFIEDQTWAHIAKFIGIFKSTSQARKNGWGGKIEEGWTERIVKKKQLRICIWKDTGEHWSSLMVINEREVQGQAVVHLPGMQAAHVVLPKPVKQRKAQKKARWIENKRRGPYQWNQGSLRFTKRKGIYL